MSAHTNGPWGLESEVRSADGSDLVVVSGDGASTLARCNVGSSGVADTEEAEANARLMSAAPELLEALEQALLDSGRTGGGRVWNESARSAIAKARGR